MHTFIHAYMHTSMHAVCMHACMHACMYVCIYVHCNYRQQSIFQRINSTNDVTSHWVFSTGHNITLQSCSTWPVCNLATLRPVQTMQWARTRTHTHTRKFRRMLMMLSNQLLKMTIEIVDLPIKNSDLPIFRIAISH